jgi:adenylate cyclase class IV
MRVIEIEHRARFSKEEYDRLVAYLAEHAEDLGEDDKNVFFYVLPDQLLKVAHNVSKGSAKVALKLNRIGNGSAFEEIEYVIPPESVENAVKLFNHLGYGTDVTVIESFQNRHNYLLDGVELSLKYSDHWGHHIELEIVVDDEAKKDDAEKKIHAVAEKLGITLMTEEELRELTSEIQAKYKK